MSQPISQLKRFLENKSVCNLPEENASNSLQAIEQGDITQPTIVLLHGVGVGKLMWEPQIAALSQNFHVIAPDLPGFAASTAAGPFTLEKAAALVRKLIHEKSQQPVHLCGLSLGAMVAIQVYLQEPKLIASLVLSAGQVRPPRLLMFMQNTIISLLSEKKLVESTAGFIPQHYPELAEEAKIEMKQLGKRGLLVIMREMSRVNFRNSLSQITVPTLVLCGSKDTWNQAAAREMAEKIPHAKLSIIEGADHIWNLEMPELFTQTVQAFVQQVEDEG